MSKPPIQCMRCVKGYGEGRKLRANEQRCRPSEMEKARRGSCRDYAKGDFLSFAFPGGYEVVYMDKENNTLCYDCASKTGKYDSPVVAWFLAEDPDEYIYCDVCAKVINDPYAW